MADVHHFIGGKQVQGTSGRFTEYFQPLDGTVKGRVVTRIESGYAHGGGNALAAQPAWAATNPQRRMRVLMKFIDLGRAKTTRCGNAGARAWQDDS